MDSLIAPGPGPIIFGLAEPLAAPLIDLMLQGSKGVSIAKLHYVYF